MKKDINLFVTYYECYVLWPRFLSRFNCPRFLSCLKVEHA